jgi:hypothetical protein
MLKVLYLDIICAIDIFKAKHIKEAINKSILNSFNNIRHSFLSYNISSILLKKAKIASNNSLLFNLISFYYNQKEASFTININVQIRDISS